MEGKYSTFGILPGMIKLISCRTFMHIILGFSCQKFPNLECLSYLGIQLMNFRKFS